MTPPRVTITSRGPSDIKGYTNVFAMVNDGETGIYRIADAIVNTPAEIREIEAQSESRMENRRATRAGQD